MNKPVVIKSIAEFKSFKKDLKGSFGLVPTMGALHAGHASLLKKSALDNHHTVLSIFVNPTQFNDPTDLDKYPRTFDQDFSLAETCNVSAIFYPDYKEIYPDDYRFFVSEKSFSKILCGSARPGHFDGVLTVIMKLFNIVGPNKAYFGEKDFQQLTLIEDMVKAFFMPIEIYRVATFREASGLAMSSRNRRLSTDGLNQASLIYKTITTALNADEAKNILTENGFQVDYLQDIHQRRFVAAYLEGIRLIDNVTI